MTRAAFPTLIATLTFVVLAAPLRAVQREATDALSFATAAFRAREPVSKVAPELRAKFRQGGEAMTQTLLSAGYAAPDVAAHLVSTDREPAGATVAWLTKAGADARSAWTAVSKVSREPAEKVAIETMQQIGRASPSAMVAWGSTFRTAGLTAVQIGGIYRQTGSNPEETASALKDSGHSAVEVADALEQSTTDATIIEILYEIGYSAADVAQAALESQRMAFRQLLEVILAVSDEQSRVIRVSTAAGFYDASPAHVAAELKTLGVVVTIISIIVAVILATATVAAGLAGLGVSQLLAVAAVLVEATIPPGEIGQAFEEAQVDIEKAAAVMAELVPLDEAYEIIEESYGTTVEATADAFTNAGESLTDVISVVYDVTDSFLTTLDIVPPDRLNAPDVMAVLFQLFAVSTESSRDKVAALLKAGMTPENIAKNLRDAIGLDADEVAVLLVEAGMTSPTAIANALFGGGFTQPLAVAQALKDAGFSYDQVQAALMAAFTLTMQQIAQILGTVFGG